MRVVVLGGYGAVGSEVVRGLRQDGTDVLVAGRDPRRADVAVDLRDERRCRAVLSGADVVVNAAGVEEPGLVATATELGAAFVDVTASSAYIQAVHGSRPPAPVLFSVGLAPGLTNLLAAEVWHGQPIEIVVLLGAGDRHGVAATNWSYDLLGRDFTDADGHRVRNYSEPCVIELPGFGRRTVYRLDFADQHVLSQRFDAPVRTYFALDSALATTGLALLTWFPGAAGLPRGLRPPGGDRWLVLARSGARVRWAQGRNQSRGTAVMTAWAAGLATALSPGVHHLDTVASLADLPADPRFELGAVD